MEVNWEKLPALVKTLEKKYGETIGIRLYFEKDDVIKAVGMYKEGFNPADYEKGCVMEDMKEKMAMVADDLYKLIVALHRKGVLNDDEMKEILNEHLNKDDISVLEKFIEEE